MTPSHVYQVTSIGNIETIEPTGV